MEGTTEQEPEVEYNESTEGLNWPEAAERIFSHICHAAVLIVVCICLYKCNK